MKRLVRGMVKLLIAVVLISVPVSLVMVLKSAGPKRKPEVEPRRADVEVVTVRRETLEDYVVLPMVAECPEDGFVKLAAEVAGRVVAVHKRDGDEVQAGESIVEIDTETLKAQLSEAKAGYTEAELKFKRMNRLFEDRHVSEDQVETARAAFERASAQVRIADVALEKGTVKSPISGTVDRRYVDKGEFAKVGQRLADVVNISRLYAIVDVSERDRQFVRRGTKVAITFRNVSTGNPGQPYVDNEAVVRSVSDVGSDLTRTYRAQVEFENPAGLIKPGMLGTVRIKRRDIRGFVVIPNDYVVASEGEMLVYVAAGAKAVARRVQLGPTDGKRFTVRAGLRPGELIIREPRQLTPGELIRIRTIDRKELPVEPEGMWLNPATVVKNMMRRLLNHEAE